MEVGKWEDSAMTRNRGEDDIVKGAELSFIVTAIPSFYPLRLHRPTRVWMNANSHP
jgi:hypothetical protein